MTAIETAAIEAARAYGLQLRTVPDWNDEDGSEWARARKAGREQLLTALAALSDADALRVILENPGIEPDGETPFELAKVCEVQAWRERPDSFR
ncbi:MULTISPECIES: hypothetical protein [Burkholderia]|uniref:hypothetical protein n=1 Tax=Burkholderia TaxID=32008 RepID=UPI0009B22E94|nr:MULTISPECIES: hypothetical protein [Burkholderia]HDR9057937.1 hypothetical protein [Burkholderia vietnamiensis]MCF1371699.1 hypothetical protein [Burkholderia cenocepacia]MCF1389212.1 hypothetical protein [Burkholderia cenocepacia]MCG0583746.1 hypothetical protein [Burkholderia cenocepacia]MCW3639470.1 hypothetical protein [Burkholderia cenocepacia]